MPRKDDTLLMLGCAIGCARRKCFMQLEERDAQERADAERCHIRLQHLKEIGQPGKDKVLDWGRQRLPRVLADHLLRSGYSESAAILTETSNLQVCTCFPIPHPFPPTPTYPLYLLWVIFCNTLPTPLSSPAFSSPVSLFIAPALHQFPSKTQRLATYKPIYPEMQKRPSVDLVCAFKLQRRNELRVQGLTEAHIFAEAEPIVNGLRQQNCGPALRWCQENRSKLKKTKSKLEFKLRIQVWDLSPLLTWLP